MQPVEVDMAKLIQQVADLFAPISKKTGTKIKCCISDDLEFFYALQASKNIMTFKAQPANSFNCASELRVFCNPMLLRLLIFNLLIDTLENCQMAQVRIDFTFDSKTGNLIILLRCHDGLIDNERQTQLKEICKVYRRHIS